MEMSTKRKRNDLSLAQKLEIIKLCENKVPRAEISAKYDCSVSTISKIMKNKDGLTSDATTNPNGAQKRRRVRKAAYVESALFTWFADARARDAPVTTAILEEKATQLADRLESTDLKQPLAGCVDGKREMASLTRRVTVRKLTPTLLLQTNGFPLYCLICWRHTSHLTFITLIKPGFTIAPFQMDL